MTGILIRQKLGELFKSVFQNSKTGKRRSVIASIGMLLLYGVVIGGLLLFAFTQVSLKMCEPLMAADMDWLYFVILGGIAIALGVFASAFSTYSGLYLSKDNDLLLSMPIPVHSILMSRVLSVYLMGFLFVGSVLGPGIVVYALKGATVTNIVCAVIFALLLTIFVLSLSCALGWIVAKISVKLKNKSIVTAIVSIAGIAVYYYLYAKASSALSDMLLNSLSVGAKVKASARFLYLFGSAATGNVLALLVLCGGVCALFALVWWILSRSFIKITTSTGATGKKRILRDVTTPQKSLASALLDREFARLFGSAAYLLNCALGTPLLFVLAVLAAWKGKGLARTILFASGAHEDVFIGIGAAVVCLMAAMNDLTAPSISMEGKSFWIVRSLPVPPWQALRAKLRMHMILTAIPALLAAGGIAYAFGADLVSLAIMLALVLAFCAFCATFGLTLNLRNPNTEWTSESAAVKQNGNVLLALFGSWAVLGALCAVYAIWLSNLGIRVFMGACAAFFALVALILLLWIRKGGAKRFAEA